MASVNTGRVSHVTTISTTIYARTMCAPRSTIYIEK